MGQIGDWLAARVRRLAFRAHSLALRAAGRTVLACRAVDSYQPALVRGRLLGPRPLRDCAARWEAMRPHLAPPEGGGSALDLGCDLGYFTFRLAEAGYVALGVEASPDYVFLARALAEIGRYESATFLRLAIAPDNVAALPACDVVLCLSVFHHWVKHHGPAGAEGMLRQAARRAGRHLVFETGQPEEDARWAGAMAFMGPDSRAWIERCLAGLGFDLVRHLGRFATHVSPVPRDLFIASRLPPPAGDGTPPRRS